MFVVVFVCSILSAQDMTVPDVIVDDTFDSQNTQHVQTHDLNKPMQGQRQLSDVLAQSTGLSLQQLGSFNDHTNIIWRALGGSHVAIVIDGMPMIDTGLKQYNLALLPIEGLQSLTLHSMSGPLYLQTPMGGTLDVTLSAYNAKQSTWTLEGGYGSENKRRAIVSFQHPKKTAACV